MFNIVDNHTRAIVGTAKTLKGALRSVDKRDNAYGAYRFRAERQARLLALQEAFDLLSMRGIQADYGNGMLFDCRTGQDIAPIEAGQVSFAALEAFAA